MATMMRAGLSGVLALLAAFGAAPACADVYVWVDASGTTNVSNLDPPEDARVKTVIKTTPKTAAQEEAAREAARRAELQALNDRVGMLQDELERQRREAAWMPAAYAPPPPVYSPPPPYAWAPPPVQYAADTPPVSNYGCDYPWNTCGLGFGAWPYVAVVVPDGRHSHRGPGKGMRPIGPGHPIATPHWTGPVRPLGAMRRG